MGKFPVPMPPPREMLRRRQAEMVRQRKRTEGLCFLFLTAAFFVLIFSRVLMIHRNQGLGMFPTAADGDLVLVRRMSGEWNRDDLIVYRWEGEQYLGRIAALERDEVMMNDSGSLLVNGSVRDGQVLYPTYARGNEVFPQQVPEGAVYILGDHRTQSRDSRDFGSIPQNGIVGKVIAILRIGDL